MMHQFFVVEYYDPEEKIDEEEFYAVLNGETLRKLQVDDSMLFADKYFDILFALTQNVPSINPSFRDDKRKMYGLNRCGITLINSEAVQLFKNNIDSFLESHKQNELQTDFSNLLYFLKKMYRITNYLFHFGI